MPGPVRLAGGFVVQAPFGFDDAPPCDVVVVCGGPGWPEAAADGAMMAFLRSRPAEGLASVCTGAMILAATLYLIGRFYGEDARDEVARLIEYDLALRVNAEALGVRRPTLRR